MALEIANVMEALGTFDGFMPMTNPIIRGNGIQPFDENTTPAAPLGGFTRVSAGQYLIKVLRPVDFIEGVLQLTCLPAKVPTTIMCGAVLDDGVAPPATPRDIAVFSTDVGGVAVDSIFYLNLFRVATGGTANP